MNAKLLRFTFGFLAVGALTLSICSAQNKRVIEITRTDLFAEHGWNSASVSIFGIQLGMTRAEVKKLTSARGLVMKCYSKGGKENPRGLGCALFLPPDSFTTVGLNFNVADRVGEMGINRVQFQYGPRSAEISRRGLLGDTRRFVTDYSDALRRKLLGHADVVEKKDQPYFGPEFTYYYYKRGIVLRVAALPKMTGKVGPPEYTQRDLDELMFVPPQPSRRENGRLGGKPNKAR